MSRLMRGKNLILLKKLSEEIDENESEFNVFATKIGEELNEIKDLIVFWKDIDSVYLGCNKSFAKLLGLESVDEIIGKTDFDLLDREESEIYRNMDLEIITGKTVNETIECRLKNGRWIVMCKMPLYNKEGEIVGILGAGVDITDEKVKSNFEDSDELRLYGQKLKKAISLIFNSKENFKNGSSREYMGRISETHR